LHARQQSKHKRQQRHQQQQNKQGKENKNVLSKHSQLDGGCCVPGELWGTWHGPLPNCGFDSCCNDAWHGSIVEAK